jgi:hypothetical protein
MLVEHRRWRHGGWRAVTRLEAMPSGGSATRRGGGRRWSVLVAGAGDDWRVDPGKGRRSGGDILWLVDGSGWSW